MSQVAASLRTLWTDRPDAAALLETRFAEGLISGADRDDLAHFIEHGWLVWRNAIDTESIDRFVADIHNFHKHPGTFVTTNHRSGDRKLKVSGNSPDRFESLFDLYVNLASSRNVCMHPRIARFLTRVFEAPWWL